MTAYFLYKLFGSNADGVEYQVDEQSHTFLANVYSDEEQTFKNAINNDQATLTDADGNLMTPEQAKDYVKELP